MTSPSLSAVWVPDCGDGTATTSTPFSRHVVTVQLTPQDLVRVRYHAERAAVGGRSAVRLEHDRRDAMLSHDQLVGQAGEAALSRYLSGDTSWYTLTRSVRDENPTRGDEGADLTGTNIDVKCSLMRASSDPWKYRLLVRPAERHPDTVYLLALVAQDWWDTGIVTLVGWAHEQQLPPDVARDGPFAGAYVLPATALHPLPPFRITPWLSTGSPTITSGH